MVNKKRVWGMLAMALTFTLLAGCTSTNYFKIVTPHNAVEVVSDDVRVFEGASYDQAVMMAGAAGFEVILSYEGRNLQGPMGSNGVVRVMAKDADGIRPVVEIPVETPAETPADPVEADTSAVDSEV